MCGLDPYIIAYEFYNHNEVKPKIVSFVIILCFIPRYFSCEYGNIWYIIKLKTVSGDEDYKRFKTSPHKNNVSVVYVPKLLLFDTSWCWLRSPHEYKIYPTKLQKFLLTKVNTTGTNC